MSIRIEGLEKHHVESIKHRLQDRDHSLRNAIDANQDYAAMMASVGPCYAFIIGGIVVALAGYVDLFPAGRCFSWAIFAKDSGRHFHHLIKFVMKTIEAHPRRRCEAYVDPHFPEGKRLVKAMGYRYEGLLKAFTENGEDREMWAKVRNELITL